MANHHNSDAAPFEVLLVAKVLICCKKNIVTFLLGGAQQVAVSQEVPSEVGGDADFMRGEVALDGNRRSLIKKDAHF